MLYRRRTAGSLMAGNRPTDRPLGYDQPRHREQRGQPGPHSQGDHQPRLCGCLTPPKPHQREETIDGHGDTTTAPRREEA